MKKQTQYKKVNLWVASSVALAFASCKTYNVSNDWESVERYNGINIVQKASGNLQTGELPIISGQVKYFGSNEHAAELQVTFVNDQGDTVIRSLSDELGKFEGKIPLNGFSGSISLVDDGIVILFASNIFILPSYKTYNFDIKIPRKGRFTNTDGFSEQQRNEILKLDKEIKSGSNGKK